MENRHEGGVTAERRIDDCSWIDGWLGPGEERVHFWIVREDWFGFSAWVENHPWNLSWFWRGRGACGTVDVTAERELLRDRAEKRPLAMAVRFGFTGVFGI